ncbi:hypothetical protein diail_8411 [Diaporthe ilicicola]|nr:hypothetical protein diail_8411 [Diaporthe ilicicola]
MPLATDTAVPRTGPATTSRREQLIATLEALIYNDDVDLDLFQPGAPWPQARDITQQPQVPFRAPSPEGRRNIQPDYQNAPAEDSAMADAANYSQIYADPFNFFDTHPDGVTDKPSSWFSQVPEVGFDSSATTTVPSYSAPPPPPPTPPHRDGHDNSSHGQTPSHYGKINTPGNDYFSHYDFSKPLFASTPIHQNPESAYPSTSKSSDLPLFDFMSWDMFMDYGAGTQPGTKEIKNPDSTNSADDSYDDRQASASPRMKQSQQQPVQPPPEATRQVTIKRRKHHSHRAGSKCASPSPPPPSCRQSSQAAEKSCPPPPPRNQRPHSAIEKRYRAGMNEKFEALRGCIESRKRPKQESLGQALRPESTCSKGAEGGGGGGGGGGTTTTPVTSAPERKKGGAGAGNGDAASTTGGARMNKAEVLSEAAEYIQQLEDENGVMLEQLKMLVQRLRATRMALQPMTPMSSSSSAA